MNQQPCKCFQYTAAQRKGAWGCFSVMRRWKYISFMSSAQRKLRQAHSLTKPDRDMPWSWWRGQALCRHCIEPLILQLQGPPTCCCKHILKLQFQAYHWNFYSRLGPRPWPRPRVLATTIKEHNVTVTQPAAFGAMNCLCVSFKTTNWTISRTRWIFSRIISALTMKFAVPRWSSRSHATFSFACLFVVILCCCLSLLQTVCCKAILAWNVLVNSIRTSRDRIQYHDKKHNIENNFQKQANENVVWRLSWDCGYVLFRFNCIAEEVFKK